MKMDIVTRRHGIDQWQRNVHLSRMDERARDQAERSSESRTVVRTNRQCRLYFDVWFVNYTNFPCLTKYRFVKEGQRISQVVNFESLLTKTFGIHFVVSVGQWPRCEHTNKSKIMLDNEMKYSSRHFIVCRLHAFCQSNLHLACQTKTRSKSEQRFDSESIALIKIIVIQLHD